jgi:hypothetical protein
MAHTITKSASIPVFSSPAACLHAGTGAFVLAPAHALSLHPKEGSRLRIACGSAWITMDDGCDYFLAAEQTMHMPKGSRVVMESARRGAAVKFDWQPTLAPQRERSVLRGSAPEMAAQAGVTPHLLPQDSLGLSPLALGPLALGPLALGPLALGPLAQPLLDLRGAAFLAARGLAGLATALAAGLAEALTGRVWLPGLAARIPAPAGPKAAWPAPSPLPPRERCSSPCWLFSLCLGK